MLLLGHRNLIGEVERRHRRTNRRTYFVEILLVFCATLLLEIGAERLGFPGLWIEIPMTAGLLFLVGRAISGRSHDYGRTDEWTLLLLVVFSIGWLIALFWDSIPLAVELAAHLVWSMALFVPLMFKGDVGENSFGSSPEKAIELNVIANVG